MTPLSGFWLARPLLFNVDRTFSLLWLRDREVGVTGRGDFLALLGRGDSNCLLGVTDLALGVVAPERGVVLGRFTGSGAPLDRELIESEDRCPSDCVGEECILEALFILSLLGDGEDLMDDLLESTVSKLSPLGILSLLNELRIFWEELPLKDSSLDNRSLGEDL